MTDLPKKELFYEGKELFQKLQFDLAFRVFNQSYKSEGNENSLNYMLYILLLQSDYRQLTSIIENITKKSSLKGFSIYTLYWYKFMVGELDDLPEILNQMLDDDNYFLRAFAIKELSKMGKINDIQGTIQQKIKFFGLSYEMDLEEKRASLCLDYLYERYHLAIIQGKAMLKEYQGVGDVYIDFLEIIARIGKTTAIHEVLSSEMMIRQSQSDLRLLYFMAREWFRLKDYDKAKEMMQRLISNFKHNPLFHYNMGNIHLAKKNYLKAVSSYEEAISSFPFFERAYYNLGCAYFKLGDINKAIKNFEDAVKIAKKPDAIYNLSVSLIEKKELRDAYYCLNKIPANYRTKLHPNSIKQQIKELVVFTGLF